MSASAASISAALIPAAVSSALGAKPWSHTCHTITPVEKASLGRLLRPDVDSWRAEFAHKLRLASEDLLELTHRELEALPPAARAYTLAVLIDKSQLLENRAVSANSTVNIQVNNFSSDSPKSAILAALAGHSLPAPAAPSDLPLPVQTQSDNEPVCS